MTAQNKTLAETVTFAKEHPILFTFCLALVGVWKIAEWLLRLLAWAVVGVLAIVALKYTWLAIVFIWERV